MKTNITSAFGQILRRSRLAVEMNQSELAESAGLDRTFISILERCTKQPSLMTLFVDPQYQKKVSTDVPNEVLLNHRDQVRF